MKQNYNPKNYIYKKENEFTQEMLTDTLKYQKQYGFNIGHNNIAHNNEADAFRHTYMQSMLAKRYSQYLAKRASDFHEWKDKQQNQDPRETNMDMWNNHQGQQIYSEIRKEYPYFNKLSEQQQKNIIAQKVIQRMIAGKLITNINDKRKFEDKNKTIYVNSYMRSNGIKVKEHYRNNPNI